MTVTDKIETATVQVRIVGSMIKQRRLTRATNKLNKATNLINSIDSAEVECKPQDMRTEFYSLKADIAELNRLMCELRRSHQHFSHRHGRHHKKRKPR